MPADTGGADADLRLRAINCSRKIQRVGIQSSWNGYQRPGMSYFDRNAHFVPVNSQALFALAPNLPDTTVSVSFTATTDSQKPQSGLCLLSSGLFAQFNQASPSPRPLPDSIWRTCSNHTSAPRHRLRLKTTPSTLACRYCSISKASRTCLEFENRLRTTKRVPSTFGASVVASSAAKIGLLSMST